jgi:hypothetical protein
MPAEVSLYASADRQKLLKFPQSRADAEFTLWALSRLALQHFEDRKRSEKALRRDPRG